MLVVVCLNAGSLLLAALLVLPGPLGSFSLGFVGGPIALALTNVATAAALVSQAPRWLRDAGFEASWPR
jgi:fucose 4-O-acetylase-like acetyltransferase